MRRKMERNEREGLTFFNEESKVMYYWYKKFKDEPNSDMDGFTRVLHSGKADEFMDEAPTFVAEPLKDGLDQVFDGFF